MGTKLEFNPLPEGYRFNLLNKIYMKTGFWPATSTTSSKTYLNFIEDLTAQQITDVENIIGDGSTCQNPIVFALSNNRYIIKDIWEYRADIEAEVGFNVAITYRSSGTYGSDVYDEIVVQPTDPTYQAQLIMTNPQKNTLLGALEDLIRLE